MDKNIMQKLSNAKKGYSAWKNLTKHSSLNETIYMLVYPGEEGLIKYISKYLYSYMYEKRVNKIMLISCNSNVINHLKMHFYNNKNISLKEISEKELMNILHCYSYYQFSDRLMILSIKNLYGRNVTNLIGKNGITEEDLFVTGLFNLDLAKVELHNDRTDWSFRVRT